MAVSQVSGGQAAEQDRRLKRFSVPVWTLLVALTIVPTAGMLGFAWRDLQGSERDSGRSTAIEASVGDLLHLRRLVHALPMEHVPSQALAQAGEFGVTQSEASELLGFDLVTQMGEARELSDSAITSLPEHFGDVYPQLATIGEDLVAARALVAEGNADFDEVNVAYLGLTESATTAADQELANLLGLRSGATGDRLKNAVRDLANAIEASDAAMAQIWALADSFFNRGGFTATQGLIATRARVERVNAELDRHLTGTLADSWSELRASEEFLRTAAAADEAVGNTDALATDDLSAVGQIFGTGIARSELLAGFGDEVGAATLRVAAAERDIAQLAQRRTIVFTAAIVLAVLILAVLMSSVITRPLQKLASAARQVSGGKLDDVHLDDRGPTEIAVASVALDEVVVNLRRLETQAQALARGDLEDGVLASTVPNALGRSLHESVSQLSRSIRAQEELRDQLAHQATVDVLTGLPNRAGAIGAIERALARTRRAGQKLALLYVDLDGFKRTNDDHGHATGDAVLRTIAERLVSAVRTGDVVCRIGGDEFIIVAEPADSVTAMVELGQRIILVVSEPIEVDGRRSKVGASIGVAMDRNPEAGPLGLLSDADQAVYRAKRSGRGRVEVFDEVLAREIAERSEIERALRVALDEEQLVVHYQPVLDATTLELRSLEALVRWNRPGHGLASPGRFIPIAEGSDLVIEIGRWVLGEATRRLVELRDELGLGEVDLGVNLSGRHVLNTCVVGDVLGALERSGLEPERLIIEITETVALGDNDAVVEHLDELRVAGVRVAIDDFGTGYTSMSQLGRLPVDVLKIDKMFVQALRSDDDRSVVELTVGVAHTLGLGLIAEGVESQEQLTLLREMACDQVQGYLFSRALESDALLAWLQTHGMTPRQQASGTSV